MPPTLFLSPTIGTSVEHSLQQINSFKAGDLFSPITILLPTARVIQDFRKRLGNRINVQFSQFSGLGQDILDASGSQIYEISDTSVRLLPGDIGCLGSMSVDAA